MPPQATDDFKSIKTMNRFLDSLSRRKGVVAMIVIGLVLGIVGLGKWVEGNLQDQITQLEQAVEDEKARTAECERWRDGWMEYLQRKLEHEVPEEWGVGPPPSMGTTGGELRVVSNPFVPR